MASVSARNYFRADTERPMHRSMFFESLQFRFLVTFSKLFPARSRLDDPPYFYRCERPYFPILLCCPRHRDGMLWSFSPEHSAIPERPRGRSVFVICRHSRWTQRLHSQYKSKSFQREKTSLAGFQREFVESPLANSSQHGIAPRPEPGKRISCPLWPDAGTAAEFGSLHARICECRYTRFFITSCRGAEIPRDQLGIARSRKQEQQQR